MAAVDFFLKLDGVDGESKVAGFENQIQIDSWSWGETNSGTGASGGGHGAGKVVMQDFHFVMGMNKSSPKMLLACATGEHIRTATLCCRKAGGKQETFLKIKFEDVLVSSYQTGCSSHGGTSPTDQISLNFAKIVVDYKEQKQDGTLGGTTSAGYDLKKNQKV